MSARAGIAALAAVVISLSGGLAQACGRPMPAGADALIQPGKAINAALLDAAVLSEVNYYRCRSGLSRLAPSASLRRVAETHAKWMARTMNVSHRSTVGGQSTLRARLSTSGVKFKTGAENIGMVHRFRIDGMSFRINGQCSFSTYGGQPIPAHTYASLARTMVEYWYNSPGHRANMMNRSVKVMGSGAALNTSAPYCGQFYMSQNFAG
ncbi:MAG: CAP domain-containing protein [Rhodobacteraceae bacterium]|nr:CAP domain-containing protein [Paracoccaceae bacterium]